MAALARAASGGTKTMTSKTVPRRRPLVINGRFLSQPISGVQRYAREQVAALDRLIGEGDSQRSVRLLAPKGVACDLPLRHIAFETAGPLSGHAWEQTTLAAAARGASLLSLTGSGPLLHPRHTVVIHDAAVHRFPGHFGKAYAIGHQLLDRGLARTARLATVSHFSARELGHYLCMDPQRIAVAPNGSDHFARLQPDDAVRDRLGLDGPYFLTVGNLTHNKNLAVVMAALKQMERQDFKVVIAGRPDPRIFASGAVGEDSRVISAGRVSDEALLGLYRGAVALVFPSRYEGFGIPPLEAFSAGTLVAAASIDAVQEVCGDAALYFDPDRPNELAAVLDRLLSGEVDRDAMLERGRRVTETYTWARSARILLDLIEGEEGWG